MRSEYPKAIFRNSLKCGRTAAILVLCAKLKAKAEILSPRKNGYVMLMRSFRLESSKVLVEAFPNKVCSSLTALCFATSVWKPLLGTLLEMT